MKTIYFTLILLVFASCKKNVQISETGSKSTNSELQNYISTPRTETKAISDMTRPYVSNIDLQKMKILTNGKGEINSFFKGPSPQAIYGPYYKKGTLTLAVSNFKVFISNTVEPRLASGYYFCDVYADNAQVSLSPGAVGILNLDLMPKYGYSDYSNLIRGVVSSQAQGPNYNIYSMTTYSLVVKYNMLGQYIGLVSPYDLTNILFAYSYWL